MTAPARLLQLHGVVIDLIYNVDAVPQPGSEAIVSRFQIAPGGGFNAMVAARRSGMAVSYAGAVGFGPFGDVVAKALSDAGIEQLRSRTPGHDQGCCTVMVDPTGERTFVSADGAEGIVSPADLEQINLPDFGWSLLSGYALFYERSRDALTDFLLRRTEIPNLVFDPSPVIAFVRPEARDAALSRALWVSANAAEAAILTGEDDPETAAQLLAKGRPSHGGAVVRDGARGSVVSSGGKTTFIRAHKVDPIDTNGAGDAHLGAFIAALARGLDPKEAALFANVAAALSTTVSGPSTAPDLATIERTLQLKRAG